MKFSIPLFPLLAVAGLSVLPGYSQNTRPRAYTVQTSGTSYLGIGVRDISSDRAKTLNLKEVRGAEITSVDENSPSEKAGLKAGDVVLEFNGAPVEGVEQFIRLVHETPPGRSAKLVVWRNGATQDITVTVGERQGNLVNPGGPMQLPDLSQLPNLPPNFPNIPPIDIPRFQFSGQSAMLGIEGESLGQERQLADFFGVKDGVLVRQVIRNSPAEKAGLKAGDVITKVNSATVDSTRDITAQLRATRSSRTVALTVVREKREMPLTVNFEGSGSNANATAPQERF
jgi:serine protease Do